MTIHLLRDMENLKAKVLEFGSMVEEAINKSMTALLDRRNELAYEVITGDAELDEREIVIEDHCLKLLALHQPVAADLRYIIVLMKVNNDLERMGDLAVNISERAMYLAKHAPVGISFDFEEMVERVRVMVRDALDSLVNRDVETARRVIESDDVVDQFNRDMFKVMQNQMREAPDTIERCMQLLSSSRHLERAADLATNIAEDVIFMVTGEVIRHREFISGIDRP